MEMWSKQKTKDKMAVLGSHLSINPLNINWLISPIKGREWLVGLNQPYAFSRRPSSKDKNESEEMKNDTMRIFQSKENRCTDTHSRQNRLQTINGNKRPTWILYTDKSINSTGKHNSY